MKPNDNRSRAQLPVSALIGMGRFWYRALSEVLNKLSPRRTPGSRCLIWLDSGVRRNDVVDLFSVSLEGLRSTTH